MHIPFAPQSNENLGVFLAKPDFQYYLRGSGDQSSSVTVHLAGCWTWGERVEFQAFWCDTAM